MNTAVVGWVVVGIAAWCVAAVVLGVVIGRVIRMRDREVPRSQQPVTGIPTQRPPSDPARDRDREVRGR